MNKKSNKIIVTTDIEGRGKFGICDGELITGNELLGEKEFEFKITDIDGNPSKEYVDIEICLVDENEYIENERNPKNNPKKT